MKDCHLLDDDDVCSAQPDAECISCILGLSEIEMKNIQRFLEAHEKDMREVGMSRYAIKCLIDAVTV